MAEEEKHAALDLINDMQPNQRDIADAVMICCTICCDDVSQGLKIKAIRFLCRICNIRTDVYTTKTPCIPVVMKFFDDVQFPIVNTKLQNATLIFSNIHSDSRDEYIFIDTDHELKYYFYISTDLYSDISPVCKIPKLKNITVRPFAVE
jgi:hypothetical protein